jgi:hypothetical protein
VACRTTGTFVQGGGMRPGVSIGNASKQLKMILRLSLQSSLSFPHAHRHTDPESVVAHSSITPELTQSRLKEPLRTGNRLTYLPTRPGWRLVGMG